MTAEIAPSLSIPCMYGVKQMLLPFCMHHDLDCSAGYLDKLIVTALHLLHSQELIVGFIDSIPQ